MFQPQVAQDERELSTRPEEVLWTSRLRNATPKLRPARPPMDESACLDEVISQKVQKHGIQWLSSAEGARFR